MKNSNINEIKKDEYYIKYKEFDYLGLVKEIMPCLKKLRLDKKSSFEYGPYASDFNEDVLYEMAEDAAMETARRVINLFHKVNKNKNYDKDLVTVDPRGMFNYAKTKFINDCTKKYISLTQTEVHGSITTVSSDEALLVASNKNQYDPEVNLVTYREFDNLIAHLKKKDEIKNRQAQFRQYNKAKLKFKNKEDQENFKKILFLKSSGYNFLEYNNKNYRKELLSKNDNIWREIANKFPVQIEMFLKEIDPTKLHQEYDLKIENNDFFFMSDVTDYILKGYTGEEIQSLLGLNVSGVNKQKRNLIEESRNFLEEDWSLFNQFLNQGTDPRLLGKKIKQSYFQDEELELRIEFCSESFKNKNTDDFNLSLKGILKLYGKESNKLKFTKIESLEKIKRIKESELFKENQNLLKKSKNLDFVENLNKKYFNTLKKEYLKDLELKKNKDIKEKLVK